MKKINMMIKIIKFESWKSKKFKLRKAFLKKIKKISQNK